MRKFCKKMRCFQKKLHSRKYFYTTAGRDGRDKFQVCNDNDFDNNVDDDDNVRCFYIWCKSFLRRRWNQNFTDWPTHSLTDKVNYWAALYQPEKLFFSCYCLKENQSRKTNTNPETNTSVLSLSLIRLLSFHCTQLTKTHSSLNTIGNIDHNDKKNIHVENIWAARMKNMMNIVAVYSAWLLQLGKDILPTQ